MEVVMGGSEVALPGLGDGFDEFWEVGVRKVGKPSARRAYVKALGRVDGGVLLAAWVRHNGVWAGWPRGDRTFIPHPATWLNDDRWDGDDPEPRGGTASDAFGALAERWGFGGGAPGLMYSGLTIAGTVVDDNTSGWGNGEDRRGTQTTTSSICVPGEH